MLKCLYFVIYGIFTTTASHYDTTITKTGKHRSVNLALETVLEFKRRNNGEDITFLDNIHNFIDKIKTVINKNNILKQDSNNDQLETFTDFMISLIKVINKYEDNDIEHLFAVISDEMRKYHYKGSKFHELTDNYSLRRYIARKLDEFKDLSGAGIKARLAAIADKIEKEKYNENERELIDFINSLYSKDSITKFNNILTELDRYRLRNGQNINLVNIVRKGVRSVFFDYYTDLNFNARAALKAKLDDFWKYSMDVQSLIDPQEDVQIPHITTTTRTIERQEYNDRDEDKISRTQQAKKALRTEDTEDKNKFDWEYDPNPQQEWETSTIKIRTKKRSLMSLYPAYVASWHITPGTKKKRNKPTTKQEGDMITLRQMYMEKNLDLKYDPYAYDHLTTETRYMKEKDERRATGVFSTNKLKHRKTKHLKVVTIKPYVPPQVKRFDKFHKYEVDSNKPIKHSDEDEKHLHKYEIHLKRPKSKSKKSHRKKKAKTPSKPTTDTALHPIGLLINDRPKKPSHLNKLRTLPTNYHKNKRLRTISSLPKKKHRIHGPEGSISKENSGQGNHKNSNTKDPRIKYTTHRIARTHKHDTTLDDNDDVTDNAILLKLHKNVEKNFKKRTRNYIVTTKINDDGLTFDESNKKEEFSFETMAMGKITTKEMMNFDPWDKYGENSKEDSEFFPDSKSKEKVKQENPSVSNIKHHFIPIVSNNKNAQTFKDKSYEHYLHDKTIREVTTTTMKNTKTDIAFNEYPATFTINLYDFSPKDKLTEKAPRPNKMKMYNELRTKPPVITIPSSVSKENLKHLDISSDMIKRVPFKEDFADYQDNLLGDGPQGELDEFSHNPSIRLDKNTRSSKEDAAIFDDNLSMGELVNLEDASVNQLKMLAADVGGINFETDLFRKMRPKKGSNEIKQRPLNRRSNSYHMSVDKNILKRIRKLENEIKVVKYQIKDDNEVIKDLKSIIREKEQKRAMYHRLRKFNRKMSYDKYNKENKEITKSNINLHNDFEGDNKPFDSTHTEIKKRTSLVTEKDLMKQYHIEKSEQNMRRYNLDNDYKKYKAAADLLKKNVEKEYKTNNNPKDHTTNIDTSGKGDLNDVMLDRNAKQDSSNTNKGNIITEKVEQAEAKRTSSNEFDLQKYKDKEYTTQKQQTKAINIIKGFDEGIHQNTKDDQIILSQSNHKFKSDSKETQDIKSNKDKMGYSDTTSKEHHIVKERIYDIDKNVNGHKLPKQREEIKENHELLTRNTKHDKENNRKNDNFEIAINKDTNKLSEKENFTVRKDQFNLKDHNDESRTQHFRADDVTKEYVKEENYVKAKEGNSHLDTDRDTLKTDRQSKYEIHKDSNDKDISNPKIVDDSKIYYHDTVSTKQDESKPFNIYKHGSKNTTEDDIKHIYSIPPNKVPKKYDPARDMIEVKPIHNIDNTEKRIFLKTTKQYTTQSDIIYRSNSVDRTDDKGNFKRASNYELKAQTDSNDNIKKDRERYSTKTDTTTVAKSTLFNKDLELNHFKFRSGSEVKQGTKVENIKHDWDPNKIASKSDNKKPNVEIHQRPHLDMVTKNTKEISTKPKQYGKNNLEDETASSIRSQTKESRPLKDLNRNQLAIGDKNIKNEILKQTDITGSHVKDTITIKPNKVTMDATYKTTKILKPVINRHINIANNFQDKAKPNTQSNKNERENKSLEREVKQHDIEQILIEDNWEKINPSKMFSELDQRNTPTVPFDRKPPAKTPIDYNRKTTHGKTDIRTYATKTLFPEVPPIIDRIQIDNPGFVNPLNVLKPAHFALLEQSDQKSDLRKIGNRPMAPMVGEQKLVVENPAAMDKDLKEKYYDKIKGYTLSILDDFGDRKTKT